MKIYDKVPILCLIWLATMVGCKKLVVIGSGADGKNTPVFVEDFERILNNKAICEDKDYGLLDYISDNFYLSFVAVSENRFALWEDNPWDASANDPIYGDCYKWINQMNLVIDKMPTAPPTGNQQRRAIAVAQARIHRAYFYLQLVNTYGPAYRAATAGTDLAVPLVLHVNSETAYKRASVEQVYQQVLADLEQALATPDLPDFGVDVIHPGRAAALALQARAQLYMGNYGAAIKAAAAVLNIRSGLIDYNITFGNKFESLLDQENNPELLLARIPKAAARTERTKFSPTHEISDILYNMKYVADPEIITVDARFNELSLYAQAMNVSLNINNKSVGVPEMMLIKAECLARANDVPGAIDLVNKLRKCRMKFYTGDGMGNTVELDVPITADVNAETALRIVLDERQRELILKGGLRVFDLKRLDLDPRFSKELVRWSYLGPLDYKIVARLPAGQMSRLIIPFSPQTLAANPLLAQP